MAKKKAKIPAQRIKCPSCRTLNPATNAACNKCNSPLQIKEEDIKVNKGLSLVFNLIISIVMVLLVFLYFLVIRFQDLTPILAFDRLFILLLSFVVTFFTLTAFSYNMEKDV